MTVLRALEVAPKQPARILKEDWDNTWPIIDVIQAFSHGRIFLGLTLLGTVLTIVYTIMLGSLQVSASFYGATTFHADLDGVIAVAALNAYALLLSLSALVFYALGRWQGKGWIRGADTSGKVLAKILWSEELQEDVKESREKNTKSTHQYGIDPKKHQPIKRPSSIQKIKRF